MDVVVDVEFEVFVMFVVMYVELQLVEDVVELDVEIQLGVVVFVFGGEDVVVVELVIGGVLFGWIVCVGWVVEFQVIVDVLVVCIVVEWFDEVLGQIFVF